MFDRIFAFFALLLTSPIFLLVSILIFINDGFPIFFKHSRVGKKGKTIKVYKFRSMVKNAEKILREDKKLYNEYINNDFKIDAEKDPRILPFGIFIRKSSIDELPQFINVLKGDMSVVGPRPVVKDELYMLYGESAQKYLSVKPGITGLWQASGRSNIVGANRVKLDLEGIEKKSFFYDIKIILKTIIEIFKKTGAH